MLKLAFYRAKYGSYQDTIISYSTLGPYSHVELVFSNGEWFSASPRDKGSRFKKIIPKPKHWDFIDINCTEAQEATIYAWCKREEGKPYDWIGVVGTLVSFDSERNHKWFCSEVCACALRKANALRYRTSQISPNRLYRIIVSQNR